MKLIRREEQKKRLRDLIFPLFSPPLWLEQLVKAKRIKQYPSESE